MRERAPPRSVAYGVAVLATAVTIALRWLLWPLLGDAVPHMFFFPAVMIAAYYGGFAPGLLSTLLCVLAANYLFTEPRYSLQIKNLNAALREGRYDPELWKTRTKHTVEELADEWKKTLEAAPPP